MAVLLTAVLLAAAGCKVKYSFSGASIHPDAKTFSVTYFANNAQMVNPNLSQTVTDALIERFERQTRLSMQREEGDLSFEGQITGYDTRPSSISGDEYATMNRLTITVRVSFTNALEPQYNFQNRSFSSYADYSTSQLLQDAEPSLVPEIVEEIINQIFNAAVANW